MAEDGDCDAAALAIVVCVCVCVSRVAADMLLRRDRSAWWKMGRGDGDGGVKGEMAADGLLRQKAGEAGWNERQQI